MLVSEILSREESTQISEVKYTDDKVCSIVSGYTQTVPEKTKYSHTTKDEHVSNESKSLPLLISFNNGLLWNGDC